MNNENQERIRTENRLKVNWLNWISTSTSTYTSSCTSTSTELTTVIDSTLSQIRFDQRWLGNAILDFLHTSAQRETLTTEVLHKLLQLGLSSTQIANQNQSSNWRETLKNDEEKAELLSIRYHLTRFNRLFSLWKQLFGNQQQQQPQEASQGTSKGEEDDPWSQDQDSEIQDEYSFKSTKRDSASERPSSSTSTFNPPPPPISLPSFLIDSPLTSILQLILLQVPISTVSQFLVSLHPSLRSEIHDLRFELQELLIRSRMDCLEEIVDQGLLSKLGDDGKEVSIWEIDSKNSDKDLVDDKDLQQALIELDHISQEEKLSTQDQSNPEFILNFYSKQIKSLEEEMGLLEPCLILSNWVSSFHGFSSSPDQDFKFLSIDLEALIVFNQNLEEEVSLNEFRSRKTTLDGKVDLTKSLLDRKKGIEIDERIFNFIKSISSEPKEASSIFIKLLLDFSSTSTSNPPSDPFSQITSLLSFNQSHSSIPITSSTISKLILSILLSHNDFNSKTLSNFKQLQTILQEVGKHLPQSKSTESTSTFFQTLVKWLIDSQNSSSSWRLSAKDLFSKPESPLFGENSTSNDNFLSTLLNLIPILITNFSILQNYSSIYKSLSYFFVIRRDVIEQRELIGMICRNVKISGISKKEKWEVLLNDLLEMKNGFEELEIGDGDGNLIDEKEVLKLWFDGVLSTAGEFRLMVRFGV